MPSVTRKAQGDRAERRRETTARMVTATETLLDEGRSFTELSVERLSSQAGISRSTFYAYFEDKGHLLRELTTDVLGQMGVIAAEWWGDPNRDISKEELEEILRRLFRAYREHDRLIAALADTASYDAAVREVYDGMISGFIAAITELIERRQAGGGTPAELPAREIATMFTWMTERTLNQAVRGAPPELVDGLARANTEILWRTLYLQR